MALFSLLVVIAWPVTDTWLLSAMGTRLRRLKDILLLVLDFTLCP